MTTRPLHALTGVAVLMWLAGFAPSPLGAAPASCRPSGWVLAFDLAAETPTTPPPGRRPHTPAISPQGRGDSAARVELIDGRCFVGPVADAPNSANLLLRPARGPVTLRMAEVLRVELRPEPPYRPPDPGVVLRSGDRLTGRIGVVEGRHITVHTALFGAVRLKLDEVAALVFGDSGDGMTQVRESEGGDDTNPVPVILGKPPGVVLANDTFVAGRLRWLGRRTLAIDSPVLGLVEIPRTRVRRCLLASVARRTPAEGRAVRVRRMNGDLITGRLVRLGATAVVMETPWLGRRSIPTAGVQRVSFLGGGIRPLTDLAPVETKTVPFFDAVRPPRLGTSVMGRPIRIGRRTYLTGWGVESRTELTFRLDGRYDYLRVDIGIDEEVGRGGSVVFLVELDGKGAYKSGVITGAMEAVPVRVKVSGAKVMRLIVDFGDQAHVRDHADWADPVLITAP